MSDDEMMVARYDRAAGQWVSAGSTVDDIMESLMPAILGDQYPGDVDVVGMDTYDFTPVDMTGWPWHRRMWWRIGARWNDVTRPVRDWWEDRTWPAD